MIGMTIGQLADAAGVGVETIRFYQREGLLREPPKGTGFRRYDPTLVRRIHFIRTAKDLGFALKEIRELLALRASHGASCESVKARATAKLEDIDRKLAELTKVRAALAEVAASCSGDRSIDTCTILDAFFRAPSSAKQEARG